MNQCYCVTHNKQLGKDTFMWIPLIPLVWSVSQKQFVPISLAESTKNDAILKDGKHF